MCSARLNQGGLASQPSASLHHHAGLQESVAGRGWSQSREWETLISDIYANEYTGGVEASFLRLG